MANSDSTLKSYRLLCSMKSSIDSLSSLSCLIPEGEEYHSIIRVVSERIDSDFKALELHVISLWPDVSASVEGGES